VEDEEALLGGESGARLVGRLEGASVLAGRPGGEARARDGRLFIGVVALGQRWALVGDVGRRAVGGVGVGPLGQIGTQGLGQGTLRRGKPRGGNSAPRFSYSRGQHFRE